jgi:hypothetical protein
VKTVKNVLTGLRKEGVMEATGETEGRAEQVRLSVPTSYPYRDGTQDGGYLVNHASSKDGIWTDPDKEAFFFPERYEGAQNES